MKLDPALLEDQELWEVLDTGIMIEDEKDQKSSNFFTALGEVEGSTFSTASHTSTSLKQEPDETEAMKKLKNRLAQRQHRLKAKADKERLKNNLHVHEEMTAKILSENAALKERVAALEAQVKVAKDPKKRVREASEESAKDDGEPAKRGSADAASNAGPEVSPAGKGEKAFTEVGAAAASVARPGAFPAVSPPPAAMAPTLERYRGLVCNQGRKAMEAGDEETLARICDDCLVLARELFSGLAQTTPTILAKCDILQEELWCCQPAQGLTPEEAHGRWEELVRTELALTDLQKKFILNERARFLGSLATMFSERKGVLLDTSSALLGSLDFSSPGGGSANLDDALASIMALRASINMEKAARVSFAEIVLSELRPSQILRLLMISAPSFPNILSLSNILKDQTSPSP